MTRQTCSGCEFSREAVARYECAARRLLLAACGSERGASREVFRLAPTNGWTLLTTPYVLAEAVRNLPKLPPTAVPVWESLRPTLQVREDILSLSWAAVFPVAKDRPVLFSALAWADVLLTLDHNDFGTMLGGQFYGLPILKPAMFLEQEIAAGRLERFV